MAVRHRVGCNTARRAARHGTKQHGTHTAVRCAAECTTADERRGGKPVPPPCAMAHRGGEHVSPRCVVVHRAGVPLHPPVLWCTGEGNHSRRLVMLCTRFGGGIVTPPCADVRRGGAPVPPACAMVPTGGAPVPPSRAVVHMGREPRPSALCRGAQGWGTLSLHPEHMCPWVGTQSRRPMLKSAARGASLSSLCCPCPPPPVLSLRTALMCTGEAPSTLQLVLTTTRVEILPVLTCTGVERTPSARCWSAQRCESLPPPCAVVHRGGEQYPPPFAEVPPPPPQPPPPPSAPRLVTGRGWAAVQLQYQRRGMTPAAAAAVRELPPECGDCSTPVAPRLMVGRAWLRCRCSSRTAATHGLLLLPCGRCSLSAAVQHPHSPSLISGAGVGCNAAAEPELQQYPGCSSSGTCAAALVQLLHHSHSPSIGKGAGVGCSGTKPPCAPPCADVQIGWRTVPLPCGECTRVVATPSTLC